MTSSISFIDSLQLLFIALKLLGKIDWTWWWVLSPIWISLSIYALTGILNCLKDMYIDDNYDT